MAMQLPLFQSSTKLELPQRVHVRLFVPDPLQTGFFRTNTVSAQYFSRFPSGLEINTDPAAFYLVTQGPLSPADFRDPAVLKHMGLWGRILEQLGTQPFLGHKPLSSEELEARIRSEARVPVRIAYQPTPPERSVLYETGMDTGGLVDSVKAKKLVFEPGISTLYIARDPSVQKIFGEMEIA